MAFDVYEPTEIENIDEVRQVKNVLPVTSNVLLKLSKVTAELSEDKKTKTFNCSYKLVDGIPLPKLDEEGKPTGETEIRYKGAMATSFPQRVMYWVNSEKVQEKINSSKKESTSNWWKNKQYLVEFKQLLVACGIDPKLEEFKEDGKLVVDSLISALKDKEVMGNITQKEETAFDNSTGERKPLGTYQNEVKNLRKVS